MISASHNDEKWNALKLLDNNGEFLSPEKVSLIIEEKERKIKKSDTPGKVREYYNALRDHINLVSSQALVFLDKISEKKFKIAVDGINSVGGIAIPQVSRSFRSK